MRVRQLSDVTVAKAASDRRGVDLGHPFSHPYTHIHTHILPAPHTPHTYIHTHTDSPQIVMLYMCHLMHFVRTSLLLSLLVTPLSPSLAPSHLSPLPLDRGPCGVAGRREQDHEGPAERTTGQTGDSPLLHYLRYFKRYTPRKNSQIRHPCTPL